MLQLIAAIIVGAFLGVLGAKYLFVGSWLSLVLWGIVGLALGYWSGKRKALLNGAVFGFVISFVFMAVGYSGVAPFISRIPFFALLGLFGAVCGLVLGWLGSLIRSRVPIH